MQEQDQSAPVPRAMLVALDTGEYDVQVSLAELGELARSAGAEPVAVLTQRRPAPDAATCIGSGRAEEAARDIAALEIELVIFDRELSGSQIANLENVLGCRVIDRTMLILDIFAQRAQSSEGRLQVELAQQRYLLPRLVGRGTALSRLGGGIGTRGPGETKLESDRRHIRRRIAALERELEQVRSRRTLIRGRRTKNEMKTVAIMGYTNVGKSTLLNALTGAGVLEEDKLFATLDPTARRLCLPDGRAALLIDTVGLVRRLPHHLVDAFRSTLEEATNADLLLNVCDISSPEASEQIRVTQSLLEQLHAGHVPVLNVCNKCDKVAQTPFPLDPDSCLISAKTGFGLDALLEKIAGMLDGGRTRTVLLLPYSEGSLAGRLREKSRIFSEEFLPEGIRMDLLVENRLLESCKKFMQP
jgi:GTP-binding protein HflX